MNVLMKDVKKVRVLMANCTLSHGVFGNSVVSRTVLDGLMHLW